MCVYVPVELFTVIQTASFVIALISVLVCVVLFCVTVPTFVCVCVCVYHSTCVYKNVFLC